MKRSEELKRYILAHGEELIADTVMLCQHQSTTARKDLADKCADAIIDLMKRRLGVEPEKIFYPEDRGRHLFYRIGTGRPKAILIGHYDTVWDPDTLPMVRDGNRLAGPGVYDMKYGLVAGIWALKAIMETGDGDLGGCVGFFMNSDEEAGSRSSRDPLQEVVPEFQNALVLEPSKDFAVKTGRKATGNVYIEIEGVASHAGTDYTSGRSAILEAARLTEKLFSMTDVSKGTTVNVGTVSGGTKTNVVAGHCALGIDLRASSEVEGERLLREIYALQPTQDGVKLTVTGGLNRPPFEFTEKNRGLFAIAREAGAELGMEVRSIVVGGGSDGNFTSSWGIPTLDGLGPMGDGAHAVTEHILIEESLRHTALLTALLQRL